MKKKTKIVISIVLSLLTVFAVIPNLGLKAEAKSASVGIGTTWHVGDTIDAGEAYFDIDHTEPGFFIDRIKPGSVLPSPEFQDFWYDVWCFYGIVRDYSCFCAYGSQDLEPTGITIVSGSGTLTDPYMFAFVYDNPSGKTGKASDWLEPLKTELNIAADAEFGGNVKHTAEYTGDFALPKEILVFLKDHPHTTLIYTYMRDELTPVTVKIEGSKVKLQDGVDWYGIDNLIKTYGVYKK